MQGLLEQLTIKPVQVTALKPDTEPEALDWLEAFSTFDDGDKRGDVIVVAAGGDYDKPRPAGIVQTDALSAVRSKVSHN